MSGWAPALRAARRDSRRRLGRTALVLVMVGLPVATVIAADVLSRTIDISLAESLPQRLGHADALVQYKGTSGPVQQNGELTATRDGVAGPDGAAASGPRTRTTEQVLTALPPGSRLLPTASGQAVVTTALGRVNASAVAVDVRDRLLVGAYETTRGHLPTSTAEVAVSGRLARRGFPVGSTLTSGSTRLEVVGLLSARSGGQGQARDQDLILTLPGTIPLPTPTSWFASVPGGLDWSRVTEVNKASLFVLSREVILHPTAQSRALAGSSQAQGVARAGALVAALIAAMSLLQVVLLAGPAFAVGARKQRRTLALLAATGATPKHVRRFVLAQGVVLGAAAAVGGALLGMGAGSVIAGQLSHLGVVAGPFDYSLRTVVVVAGVGFLSAVLAALMPALSAGRQDVLAGLTGRRGVTGGSVRTLAAGMLLFAIGILACVRAAGTGASTTPAVGGAVLTVLGAALLAPSVLSLTARLAHLLPLSPRFALRDAARARGRTASAIAAVTATVAAVTALAIGGASDGAERKATYTPTGPYGAAIISNLSTATDTAIERVRAAATRLVPGATVKILSGAAVRPNDGQLGVTRAPYRAEDVGLVSYYGGISGADLLVGAESLGVLNLSTQDREAARAALNHGGIAVFSQSPLASPEAVLSVGGPRSDGTNSTRHLTLPAARLTPSGNTALVPAIVSEATARQLGLQVRTVGLLVSGPHPISKALQDRLSEAVSVLAVDPSVTVERGYDGGSTRLALLLLACAGGALVLGGVLSSSLLALADARPDFGTLMAVGASPRIRRSMAASYAAVIGLLGALLGALAGLGPGIAVAFPLTSQAVYGNGSDTRVFIDIPWLLLTGLAIGVPLIAAAGAAAFTRSDLPLTARVD